MGYEIDLLIVKASRLNENLPAWGRVLATIDMHKPNPHLMALVSQASERQKKKELIYFFAPGGDGDAKITKDRYGEPLIVLEPYETINALKRDIEHEEYHRTDKISTDIWNTRYKAAISVIDAFVQHSSAFGPLHVLAFGY